MGKIAMNDKKCITNQQINSIRIDKNKFDSDYVYYILKNNYRLLRNAATGSTAIPMLNKTDFDKLKIYVHESQKTQQKIADILSLLDAKIELNNRINKELEAMAKTLYNYWFVQFDFPDINGKAYKSSGGKMVYNEALKRVIPEGWESGYLDDIGEIVGGSTPVKSDLKNFSEDGTAWITPKDLSINIGKKFITKGEIDVSEKGVKSASLKRLPKGSILLSSRAPIGYMAISRNEVTTNQGFKSFIPNKGFSTYFIYYAVKTVMKQIIQNTYGSTLKEISGSVLKSLNIAIPNPNLIDRFTKQVSSTFEKQDLLEQENQQLTQLRDWLLPMLMNGQVSVK